MATQKKETTWCMRALMHREGVQVDLSVSNKATVRYQDRSGTFDFYHNGTYASDADRQADVLLWLIADSAIRHKSFQEFCKDCGYPLGGQSARIAWEHDQAQTKALMAVLGEDFALFERQYETAQ